MSDVHNPFLKLNPSRGLLRKPFFLLESIATTYAEEMLLKYLTPPSLLFNAQVLKLVIQ